MHPFWAIKRQSSVEEEWNAELIRRHVTIVVAGDSGESGQAFTDTLTVSLPCITNSKDIPPSKCVVLKHAVIAREKGNTRRGRTWVDAIAEEERKRSKNQRQR